MCVEQKKSVGENATENSGENVLPSTSGYMNQAQDTTTSNRIDLQNLTSTSEYQTNEYQNFPLTSLYSNNNYNNPTEFDNSNRCLEIRKQIKY